MRVTLFLTAILLSFFVQAQMESKNFIDQNYIEVTGTAEINVVPDEIYLRIVINERDTKNKTSVGELEKQMAETLKELGIDIDKELLIKDLGSNFQNYLMNRDAIVLSKEYQLKVSSGKLASSVFIELEKIGISNISVEKLDNSRIENFKNEVKIKAIKAAKEKAGLLAEAVGQTSGRALFIQEQNMYQPVLMMNSISVRGTSMEKSQEPLDIEFEKIPLQYTILCRFELK